MSSRTARTIVAVYSITIGILAFIATISSEISPITIIIEMIVVGLGVFTLIHLNPKLKKAIFISLLTIHFLGALGSIPFIANNTIVGIVAFSIFLVPLGFGIVYYIAKKKEDSSPE